MCKRAFLDPECRTLLPCVEVYQNTKNVCSQSRLANDGYQGIQSAFMEAKRPEFSLFDRIVQLRLCTDIPVEFYSDLEFYYRTMIDYDASVPSGGVVLHVMLYIDSDTVPQPE